MSLGSKLLKVEQWGEKIRQRTVNIVTKIIIKVLYLLIFSDQIDYMTMFLKHFWGQNVLKYRREVQSKRLEQPYRTTLC